jgi:phage terminase large subunit-like protein
MVSRNYVPLGDLFDLAREELDQSITKPNILNYRSGKYPEQDRFLMSSAFGRYVAGGNRGGKTDAIVIDSIWWATNTHPFLARPEKWGKGAIQIRFVVVDIEKGVNQIILPKLKRWSASSMLVDGSFEKSWDSKSLVLTFANGSTIEFLTHGMDLDKHGGVPRHLVYFDEEPPQAIFNETTVRLIDYEGRWVIAATPVQGMGWTYDLLWEPAISGAIEPGEIETFTLSAEQNPYLQSDDEARQRYYIGMSDEEKRIREKGEFVARSGLVFPVFALPTHVIDPMIPPKNWQWYSSVDFGWNNPTAWLWHAVSPEGDIVTFAEHYTGEMSVPDHAATVLMREAAWGKSPEIRVGDPHGDQHQMNTGTSVLMEYALRGIHIATEGIPRGPGAALIGVEKMQQYFQLRPTGSLWGKDRPKWVVTANCVNFIRELKRLRWATYESSKKAYTMNKQETVHKKDDHAFDSARYFATFIPDLSPVLPAASDKVPITIGYAEMMARLRDDETVSFVDDRLSEAEPEDGWDTTMSFEGAI